MCLCNRMMTADQYEKELVERSIKTLRDRKFIVIEPDNVRREFLLELAESIPSNKGSLEEDGLRDPDNPCIDFIRGNSAKGGPCKGDGHYLCSKCIHWDGSVEELFTGKG